MTLLSIVIVAYKSRGEIGPCLASIPQELAGRRVEIIVVDNYPADGTSNLVRANFPWVNCVTPFENLGFGRANNLGLSHARGEFILFLNPDTICSAETLLHCIERLQKESEIGLISPRLVLADGSLDFACRRSIPSLWDGFCRAVGLASCFPNVPLFSGYNLTHLPVNGTYDVGAVNGAFMLFPRRVLEKVGLFDERFFMYGDDLDLCIRVAQAGWRIVYDGSVKIVHLKGKSVAKDYDAMSKAIFDANRDVYLKHFNPRGSQIVRWKYQIAFGLWKMIALARAKIRGRREVRPV